MDSLTLMFSQLMYAVQRLSDRVLYLEQELTETKMELENARNETQRALELEADNNMELRAENDRLRAELATIYETYAILDQKY